MKIAKGGLSRFLKERLTVETNSWVSTSQGSTVRVNIIPNEHTWDHLLLSTGMIKKKKKRTGMISSNINFGLCDMKELSDQLGIGQQSA